MQREKYSKAMTIASLKHLDGKGELKIPPVQRDLVWTKSQKQLLIDSLLKDFDIPKFYFRTIVENGTKKYEIIDGQQRLNAIFSFMGDMFEMPADADPYKGEKIANKKWSELDSSVQIDFTNRQLDVIYLVDYSDEEIDETFLRLQNGTPLKAAEKRRAIAGKMREVVKELSENDVFLKYCSFANEHFAFEDVVAKILKQIIDGKVTNLSSQALSKMYEQNRNFTIDDAAAKDTKRALDFLNRAFKNTNNPHLKRYAIADLAVIVNGFLKVYDISNYYTQFGEAYLKFANERVLNAEKPEDEQDQRLIRYGNAARGDSLEFLEYRQKVLKEYILEEMPYLIAKDSKRLFTTEQRAVIYRLGKGVCANCGVPVSEESFEADHILPWSKGGKTRIDNGQILCSTCNHEKSNKIDF